MKRFPSWLLEGLCSSKMRKHPSWPEDRRGWAGGYELLLTECLVPDTLQCACLTKDRILNSQECGGGQFIERAFLRGDTKSEIRRVLTVILAICLTEPLLPAFLNPPEGTTDP